MSVYVYRQNEHDRHVEGVKQRQNAKVASRGRQDPGSSCVCDIIDSVVAVRVLRYCCCGMYKLETCTLNRRPPVLSCPAEHAIVYQYELRVQNSSQAKLQLARPLTIRDTDQRSPSNLHLPAKRYYEYWL